MKNPIFITVTALALLDLAARGAVAKPPRGEPSSRSFQFDYAASINGVAAGNTVRVWLPVPRSSDAQQVKILRRELPAEGELRTEARHGNKILYFSYRASEKPNSFRLSYRILRREVRGLAAKPPDPLSASQREQYLAANRMVPVDGRPLALLNNVRLPKDELETARVLYDRVDDHVRYDKSKPGYGHGDVLWVCDSRFGNCTDFHSLFISLARGQNIPARFEIGFPLPVERGSGKVGGYHCWAEFYTPRHGWVPVDISEADKHPELKSYYFGNLTENRVAFSRGRDIDLVPQQSAPPLNYFVYPHVEVDGRVLPTSQIELNFSYADAP